MNYSMEIWENMIENKIRMKTIVIRNTFGFMFRKPTIEVNIL